MKWTEHQNGDTRIKTKFALLPVRINGEVRWLERVTIKQEYVRNYVGDYWKDIEFIDKD